MVKYNRTCLTKTFFRRDVIAVMVKVRGVNAGMPAPLYEHSLTAIEMIGSGKKG